MKGCTEVKLVLYNDDIHSFDFVINALMNECGHDMFQAEQCAYITHYKGECEIKIGSDIELQELSSKLEEMGLSICVVSC